MTDTGTNTVIPIQAIWHTPSGKWQYAAPTSQDKTPQPSGGRSTSLALVTWNVDFAAPNAAQRLTAALDHLQFHAFPGHQGYQPPSCVILLQEIKADAFGTLLAHPWVRAWFMVVPGSPDDGWPRGIAYGTATLVSRSVPLAGSTCVRFGGSRMGRNALLTNVVLGDTEARPRVLRVINTHLESLPEGTPQRAVQMRVIADLLHDAADMGGIENRLSDAWDVRKDEDEDDATWGYQPRSRFPPGRLDKILYTKDKGFKVRDTRKVAVGLKMPGGGWVSDHYGLACEVEALEPE
ncbi:Endonuclease/exonuclease/phosphatase [Gloeopeniophorella convolvens]|nr:Endonuclease/exonuclease/phosphatase [Gloeopeniophorella convolvens]